MNGSDMAFAEPAPRRVPAKLSLIPVCLAALLIALLAGCIVILASVPPVDRDALTHHLAVPKLYLKHGGMVEIPSVPFSYYPMNLDLLYLIPLYFGNDIVPKYIHFAFALLTAWLIYGYLRRRLEGPLWGLLGAFLFLSLPVIVKLSVTVYVDLGMIFFSTASLLYLLKWAESGLSTRLLILSGLFCGLALGTKYNALISLLLLTALVPILYIRSANGMKLQPSATEGRNPSPQGAALVSPVVLRAVCHTAVFVVVALLVCSPWMIRNIVWTGNPLYPLYQGFFGSIQHAPGEGFDHIDASQTEKEPDAEEAINHFAARRLVFNESPIETLTIPIRIFFQGQDDNPRLFDGRLNPYLVIFPIFAFLLKKKGRRPFDQTERAVLLAFSALFILFAFFQADMRIRYVGPAIPPLVILSVFGLNRLFGWLGDAADRRRAACAGGAAAVLLVWLLGQNLLYVAEQFRVIDPISYLSGELNRDQYIRKFRAEYDVIRYANANLAPGEKIICLFMGNRIYYSDRDMIQADGFFRNALLRSATAGDLFRKVGCLEASHLLVRLDVLDGFADGFDPDARRCLKTFFMSELDLVFTSRGYALFKLKETS